MRIAIYPGSFDPVTLGHMDIIVRASKIFDRVIVATLINKDKNAVFTADERVNLLEKSLIGLKNVEVVKFEGLLVDYAKKVNATTIIRGLRAVTDFEYELQLALVNKKLCKDIETVFLTTSPENIYISSSVVKQIASFNGDISNFVPKSILNDLMGKFK
ncbi:MAG: Phosphopantetheine adenylyltransferase [Eubacteriales bacterium SKADARSKE-1]|nr:Phosphopantetheine adenylyltransferase [Eubacteriales bacterium SKADARSKE-1]